MSLSGGSGGSSSPRAGTAGGSGGSSPGAVTLPAAATLSASIGELVPWLIAVAVFAPYTLISVLRYLQHDPASWDLGIFTEYVRQYANLHAPIVNIRGAGIDLLGDHFHPIVALIAPFFRVFPTPITLLVAQALLAAVSVVPVCRAGRELLGRKAGWAIGAAYGFSWGLQQLVNYDFHELAFAVPLLAFSLSALVTRRMRAAVLWAMPLVFVKEDQGLTLVAIGLIMAFGYRCRRQGLFLAGWGLAWSLLAVLVIIPHFNPDHTYWYWSHAGTADPLSPHFGPGGVWRSLSDGGSTKIETLAMILLPTAFVALRSPLALAALPGLGLRFLADNPSYWGTQWHYSAPLMPIIFIAAIDGLTRLRARKPGRLRSAAPVCAAAAMVVICGVLAFRFPLRTLATGSTYHLSPHVAAQNAAMAVVPDGAAVATDLNLLAPLAARTNTYWLGNFGTNPATPYVVFDTLSSDWQPPPQNVLEFVEGLTRHTVYQQIFFRDGVYVFRRVR